MCWWLDISWLIRTWQRPSLQPSRLHWQLLQPVLKSQVCCGACNSPRLYGKNFNHVQTSCEYLHKNSRVNIKGSSLRTMRSFGITGFALVALPFLTEAIFYNDLLSAYSISTGTLQAASLNPIIAGLFEMQAYNEFYFFSLLFVIQRGHIWYCLTRFKLCN